MREGKYAIRVSVQDVFGAKSSTSAVTSFAVTSRITGKKPVVSRTANPLVALYSAPACAGGSLVVRFRPATGALSWQAMPAQPCVAGLSVNVLVAGMRPATRYLLQQVVSSGTTSKEGPSLPFATGVPSKGLKIAPFTVAQAPTAQSDKSPIIFHALNVNPSPTLANPIATDLSGHLVWY